MYIPTCHISVTLPPCSLRPQSFLLPLVSSLTLSISPLSPILSTPLPPQHEFSNLSYFTCTNSCNHLPQPIILQFSPPPCTTPACNSARSGQQSCLASLSPPSSATTALCGICGWMRSPFGHLCLHDHSGGHPSPLQQKLNCPNVLVSGVVAQ